MFLLDTDLVSLLLRDASDDATNRLRIALQAAPADAVCVSIVTVKELTQGALAVIRREESRKAGVQGYVLLSLVLDAVAPFPLAPFDEAALKRYRSMTASTKRIGREDCQIAATALERNLVIVTRNLRHFEQIEGVRCEDWTQA